MIANPPVDEIYYRMCAKNLSILDNKRDVLIHITHQFLHKSVSISDSNLLGESVLRLLVHLVVGPEPVARQFLALTCPLGRNFGLIKAWVAQASISKDPTK